MNVYLKVFLIIDLKNNVVKNIKLDLKNEWKKIIEDYKRKNNIFKYENLEINKKYNAI